MFLIPQSPMFQCLFYSKTGSLLRFDLHKGGETKGTIMCVLLNLHHIQHSIIIVICWCLSQVLLSIERDIELKWCDLMSKVRLDPDPKPPLTEVDIKVVKCLCCQLVDSRTKLNTLLETEALQTRGLFSDNFQDRYLKGLPGGWFQIEFQTTKATVINLRLGWDLEAIWCNLDQFDIEAGMQIIGQR